MRAPQIRGNVEALLASAEGMTNVAAVMVDQYWKTYVSTTETGVAGGLVAPSVAGEVRELRDLHLATNWLTRQQVAHALGVDRRSLTSWANGSSVPAPERLERLRQLAALVREIDAHRPGHATER